MGGYFAGPFVRVEFISKANSQRDDVTEKYFNFRSEIVHKMPKMVDNIDFDSSFKNWLRNPTNVDHMKKVKNTLGSMKTEYDQLHEKFKRELNEVNVERANIEKNVEAVNNLMEKFFHTKVNRQIADGLSGDLSNLVYGVETLRNSLIEKLKNVIKTLEEYNQKRIIWAEFLIGMRDTLTTQPKAVALSKDAHGYNCHRK